MFPIYSVQIYRNSLQDFIKIYCNIKFIVIVYYVLVYISKNSNFLVTKQSIEELTLSHCGVREDSWESLVQQGDQIS